MSVYASSKTKFVVRRGTLRFEDKAFSYTDATSFALADALGVDGALSPDEHFQRYGRLEIVP